MDTSASAAEKQREFPCPGCGADFVYDPPSKLHCPHCGHVEKIPQSPEEIHEFSFEAYLRSPRATGVMTPEGKDVECKHCGAQTHVAGDVTSMRCAFCGTPLVLEAVQLPPCIRPEAVVPFAINSDQALERFRSWAKTLWFAPSELKRAATPDRIVGIYRPYWTFDSDTYSWYTGERGDAYYETEYYTDSQGNRQSREVRKIRWTRVSGQVQQFFKDILVTAGKPMEWKSVYRIESAVPYDARFLAGWQAERYSAPPERAWPVAKGEMDDEIQDLCREDIGGDEQRIHSVKTQYNAISFKHLLLPLYVSSYFYRSKAYTFQVNGQTGEVSGHRPYSFWKIFILVLVILGVIGAIILVFALSQAPSRHGSLFPSHAEKNPSFGRYGVYSTLRKETNDESLGIGDRRSIRLFGVRLPRLGRDVELGRRNRGEVYGLQQGRAGLADLPEMQSLHGLRQVRGGCVRQLSSRDEERQDVRALREVPDVRPLQDGVQGLQGRARAA